MSTNNLSAFFTFFFSFFVSYSELFLPSHSKYVKSKAITIQAWTFSEWSRRLRLPDLHCEYGRLFLHLAKVTLHLKGPSGRRIILLQWPVPDSTHYSRETEFHARGGIGNRNLINVVAADPLFRLRGHWYRSYFFHKTQTVCQFILSCHL
jgi:hypothetical protein